MKTIKFKQRIFKKSYVEEIIRNVESGNTDLYSVEDKFPIEEKNPPGETNIDIDSELTLILPTSNTIHYDLENSITIYDAFKSLSETQASDSRLWTYLTHVTFWNYMRKRWPIEKIEEDSELFEEEGSGNRKVEYILWRYHLKTPNRRRLIRNGISRLWWYSHLTYNPNKEDPYELTRILLAHQDKAQSLLERSLGSNNKVLIAVLEYLKTNPGLSREQIRDKIKEINLVGGVKNLHLLDTKEIIDIIN